VTATNVGHGNGDSLRRRGRNCLGQCLVPSIYPLFGQAVAAALDKARPSGQIPLKQTLPQADNLK